MKFKNIVFLSLFMLCTFCIDAKAQEMLDVTYSTAYVNNENRIHNIKLCAETLNGTVVESGQTFSFNESVGPTGQEQGYKEAMTFVEGEKTTDYGGGVCQVSSTLYNTALLAELDIIERNPHSLPVDYVDIDTDAAVSYGGVDLKFKNTNDYSIVVNSYTKDGRIYTQIKPYV